MSNPFIPFQIATDEQFINRITEIKTVLERVTKGASSGIVGNPHVGKSSLLRRISEPRVIAQFVQQPEDFVFVEVDFQSFVSGHPSQDFWAYVLEESIIVSSETEKFFKSLLENKTFDSLHLLGAFTRLGRSGRRIVLLIDEFDYLFNLPHFKTIDFLGPLRVLVMKSNGLVLITASRMSVAELNQKTAEYRDEVRGSDLFNYLEEVCLGCFHPLDVKQWLEPHFKDQKVIEEIRLLAGHHPLLLQLAGEIYFEADLADDRKRRELRQIFTNKAITQFQDVWNYLASKAQIALIIFALDYMRGQVSSGEEFSLEQAKKYLTWYAVEVKEALQRGTLEAGPTGEIDIGSLAFLFWIVENKIVGTRGDEPQESFTQWLAEKQFKLGGLLTQEEITWLHKVWRAIPEELIDLARKVILPKGWQ